MINQLQGRKLKEVCTRSTGTQTHIHTIEKAGTCPDGDKYKYYLETSFKDGKYSFQREFRFPTDEDIKALLNGKEILFTSIRNADTSSYSLIKEKTK